MEAAPCYIQVELFPPLFQAWREAVSFRPSLEFVASFYNAVVFEERRETVQVTFTLFGNSTVYASECC